MSIVAVVDGIGSVDVETDIPPSGEIQTTTKKKDVRAIISEHQMTIGSIAFLILLSPNASHNQPSHKCIQHAGRSNEDHSRASYNNCLAQGFEALASTITEDWVCANHGSPSRWALVVGEGSKRK